MKIKRKVFALGCLLSGALGLLGAAFYLFWQPDRNRPVPGALLFEVDTRLPTQLLSGILGVGVKVGTGRGIWKQALESPHTQAELLLPCQRDPWCKATDSETHVVMGCGDSALLYDSRTGKRLPFQVPAKEEVLALSLRKRALLTALEGTLLMRSFWVENDRLVLGERRA